MQTLQAGLDKKQLKNYIIEQLNAGILKTEIENNLNSAGYTINDYKKIISRYPELEIRKKYKLLVIIFIILEIILGLFTSLVISQLISTNGVSNVPRVIALVGFILPGIIIFYIVKNDRIGYKIALILAFLSLLKSLPSFPALVISLLFFAFVAFLGTKLFQDKKFWITG